ITSGRGFPGQRTSKKLMLRVRPGVELVRASLASTSVLITLDLPTFERPRKATSGRLGAGKCAAAVAAAMNRAITLMSSSPFPVFGCQWACSSVQCGGEILQACVSEGGIFHSKKRPLVRAFRMRRIEDPTDAPPGYLRCWR